MSRGNVKNVVGCRVCVVVEVSEGVCCIWRENGVVRRENGVYGEYTLWLGEKLVCVRRANGLLGE